MRAYFLPALCLLLSTLLPAQTPFPPQGHVFKDDVVPRVDIFLHPDSLAWIMAEGNEESNYHFYATFVFDNGTLKDTVQDIGFRLRGNTSRYAEKKSFKVSFNTYVPGRQWQGVEKLNLNGEHNDPAVIRAKVCWDMLRQMGVPAPRANHVELYINGDYFGLYINVEHIDDEFVESRFGNKNGNLYKCLYPADLVYKGANPELYKQEYWGRRAYELTINEDVDDYSDLAHFINILNNTPLASLPCELEKVFEVDNYLKALASDILSGNWDGPVYNKNNFYLYHNQASGKFEYIPYDLDNTLGIDWLGKDWTTLNIYNWKPNEPRPIYTRLLAVPAYRDRFSWYMKKFMDDIFVESHLFPYIDNIRNMIAPYADADPYRPLDYGFSYIDFLNSYNFPLPHSHTPVGLKPYVTLRRASALQQLVLNNIAPVISWVGQNSPNVYQDIAVSAQVEDDAALAQVQLCYQFGGQPLACIPMHDDGQHADGAAGDGRYGAIVPSFGQPGLFEYYIRAVDNTAKEGLNPVCGFRSVIVGAAAAPLVVNEFMASNSATYADEYGDYDDWIELFSLSDVPIYLGNYFLSDRQNDPGKWPMPDLWIQPGQYLIFWADDEEAQGIFHTNFKLSADGEFIGIFADEDGEFVMIDGLDFGSQETDAAFGRLPNGTGPFQPVAPTPGAENQPISSVREVQTEDFGLIVHPNPFSSTLHLAWEAPGRLESVRVWNALGAPVWNGGAPVSLELGDLPPGVYYVQICFEDGACVVRKAMKK
jgi:hypothetical protein